VNGLKVVSVTLGIAAATLLPASSAVAAISGRPPVANFPNAEEQTPVIDVYVEHCQPYNQGAGVRVFTPATPGESAQVIDNCRG
jgi:hypothetical protein